MRVERSGGRGWTRGSCGFRWGFRALALVFLGGALAEAQGLLEPPAEQWRRVFGDEETRVSGRPLADGPDGALFFPGSHILAEGAERAFLVRLDQSGSLEWERQFESPGFLRTCSRALAVLPDGGVLLAASQLPASGIGWDLLFLRLDARGEVVWRRSITPGSGQTFGARQVVAEDDGSFSVAGSWFPSGGRIDGAFRLRLGADGALLDELRVKLGGFQENDLYALTCPRTPGLLLVHRGRTPGAGGGLTELAAVRVDGAGNEVWRTVLSRGFYDEPCCLHEAEQGDVEVIVIRRSHWESPQTYEGLRLDSRGTPAGTIFLYSSPEWLVGPNYRRTPDGGLLILGRVGRPGEQEARAIRLDPQGNLLWQLTEERPWDALFQDGLQTRDGGYLLRLEERSPGRPQILIKLAPERPARAPGFRRGDADASGTVDITDALVALGWLFQGAARPACLAAADADGDGVVNVTDPVYLLGFLFRGGPPPVAPHAGCGPLESAADRRLGCPAASEGCR
jgi:hypothetical protein